ncbi:MAG: ACT domain-containing protein, partial [Anaerolineae bacterium]
YKNELIGRVARIDQQEVRWHVAQMLPRLEWSQEERAVVVEILLDYFNDKSRIVKTFAMQALADLAEVDASLRPQAIELLAELVEIGSPAMKSRGRKLLTRLKEIE